MHSDGIIWPNGTANGQGRQKMRRPAQPRNEESLFQLIAQGKELVGVCLATCLNWDSPICFQQLPFPHCWRAQERSPHIPVTIDQSITKKLFNINESENREMQISGTYIPSIFSKRWLPFGDFNSSTISVSLYLIDLTKSWLESQTNNPVQHREYSQWYYSSMMWWQMGALFVV